MLGSTLLFQVLWGQNIRVKKKKVILQPRDELCQS